PPEVVVPNPASPSNKHQADELGDERSQLIGLIFGLRQSQQLPIWVESTQLNNIAMYHAQDMRERGYFAHTSPEGVNLSARLKRQNIGYRKALENLAVGQDAKGIFDQWLNSPAHRRNLLDDDVTTFGLALQPAGNADKSWTAVLVMMRPPD